MITLIAESKSMQEGNLPVAVSPVASHPAGGAIANEVMENILNLSVPEIASEIKVSPTMASRIKKLAYDFPAKETGRRAIDAFTGVVFKYLDYPTLTHGQKKYIDENIRIISSLYGWLLPDDIIKPYRMEYSTRLAPAEQPFSSFWRKEVTLNIVKTLKKRNITDVINLLPGDAEKCIDKKLVKGFAKIWKVDFKIISDGGSLRTPPSGQIKKFRGLLLREMAQRDIRTPEELKNLVTPTFLPLGTLEYPDHIAFGVE